jgi:outer membrane receptor protein involved in Fe transport
MAKRPGDFTIGAPSPTGQYLPAIPEPYVSAAFFLTVLALGSADPTAQEAPPAQVQGAPPAVAELVVNGTKPDVQTSIDRQSYSLANDLQAQAGSAADALRNIPSVQVDANGHPSLRGDANVTILVDGKLSSQFSGGDLGQALQAMPAERIDRIEVMANPPPEFRAQGSGGVINIITKKAKGEGPIGSLRLTAGSHDKATAVANLGYNSEKLSVAADLTYQRVTTSNLGTIDQAQTDQATGRTAYGRDLTTERWIGDLTTLHASLDYDLDSRTRLSGMARVQLAPYVTLYTGRFSQTDFSGLTVSAQSMDSREYESFNNGEASLTFRRTFGEGHVLTLTADYKGWEGRDRRLDLLTSTSPLGMAASSQRITWIRLMPRETLTADYERPLPDQAKLKLGYDLEYAPQRADQDTDLGPIGGPTTLDPSQHGVFLDNETDNEAYASYERRLGKTTLLAGLRVEDIRFALDQQAPARTTHHDYTRVYPNLHLSYDLSEDSQLTTAFTRRTNLPRVDQLDPLPSSQTPLILVAGNPDLRPEDAYAYELGHEAHHGDRLMTETLYYRVTRDAFTLVVTPLSAGVTQQTTANAGEVRRSGAQWSLSDKLSPKLSYNLSLDAYWTEIGAANLGFVQSHSTFTGSGRANLSWQVTPNDALQLNIWANGKTLLPQGYNAGVYSGNIGYRHVVNTKASWLLTVQDPFHTVHPKLVLNENGLRDTHQQRMATQVVSLTFVWNLSGKPKDPDFDFAPGGAQ